MPSTAHLSQVQRAQLLGLLQSRLADLERASASKLQGRSQVDSARHTLLQDADDATQRSGEHEVEGTVSDIDSGEFESIRNALKRIHGADYGLCVGCRLPIPFERLQVEPEALRCAPCQALFERTLLA